MDTNVKTPDGTGRVKHKRGGLGRGLGALIPELEAASDQAGITTVSIHSIAVNPRQPRSQLDPADLQTLADSIRTHGLIQPIVLTRSGIEGGYVLVAGERRWRAAGLAGLESIPAVILDVTPQGQLELALVENLIRSDLSPLEEAQAYRQLIEDFGLTQSDVAERVGRSRVSVANTLRLLSAPDRVKEALQGGEISEGHARALLSFPSAADQIAMLDVILRKHYSVRETEAAVRRWNSQNAPGATEGQFIRTSHDLNDASVRLQRALSTNVAVRQHANGAGSIRIDFSSDEQLSELLSRIAGEPDF